MSEQCEHLIDYFNRSLTEEESLTFERHLEECPSCRAELEELNLLTEDLPFLSEGIEVPSDLKSKVFAEIDAESASEPEKSHRASADPVKPFSPTPKEGRPSKRKGIAVPVLAAALIASLMTNAYLATTENPPAEVAQRDLQLIGKSVLEPQPGSESASAIAMLVKDNTDTVLMVDASNLPQLKDNELYQVWIIDKETPQPAGSFIPEEDGKGSVTYPVDQLTGEWDTIAITIETEPDLPSPEGAVVLAGSI